MTYTVTFQDGSTLVIEVKTDARFVNSGFETALYEAQQSRKPILSIVVDSPKEA